MASGEREQVLERIRLGDEVKMTFLFYSTRKRFLVTPPVFHEPSQICAWCVPLWQKRRRWRMKMICLAFSLNLESTYCYMYRRINTMFCFCFFPLHSITSVLRTASDSHFWRTHLSLKEQPLDSGTWRLSGSSTHKKRNTFFFVRFLFSPSFRVQLYLHANALAFFSILIECCIV